jgi:catalase (peroxidase I)
MCGTGKGKDAFTSGFEFKWTPNPTQWDNVYFKQLAENSWEKYKGPGGHWQWRVRNATGLLKEVGMLTSDVSLMHDPEGEYQKLVHLWAEDQADFENAFSHAWYKLTTRDMGPVARCAGKSVPPAQPFQYPLPPPPSPLADFGSVKAEIRKILTMTASLLPASQNDGKPYHGALFVRLAWRCASTFRSTDWLGGCNGARIRFSPEREWPANAGLDKALLLLKPVKDRFGEALSWADLIVLAGSTALEEAGSPSLSFCGGRSDALDGLGSEFLTPGVDGETKDASKLKNAARVMGLSLQEWVVLNGRVRSGISKDPTKLSNSYFRELLIETWEEYVVAQTGEVRYKAKGKELYMLKSDLALRFDPEFSVVAQEYASDNGRFLADFAVAWTKLMNADRFDGPTGNVCDRPQPQQLEGSELVI